MKQMRFSYHRMWCNSFVVEVPDGVTDKELESIGRPVRPPEDDLGWDEAGKEPPVIRPADGLKDRYHRRWPVHYRMERDGGEVVLYPVQGTRPYKREWNRRRRLTGE